jgi:hypothetical protein
MSKAVAIIIQIATISISRDAINARIVFCFVSIFFPQLFGLPFLYPVVVTQKVPTAGFIHITIFFSF